MTSDSDLLERIVAAHNETREPTAHVSRFCPEGTAYMMRLPGEKPVLIVSEHDAWLPLLAGMVVTCAVEETK